MSVFNPASLAFNYPKNAGFTPNETLIFEPTDNLIAGTIQYIKPNWLNITVVSQETSGAYITKQTLNVSVNTTVANTLPVNFYQETFKIKGKKSLGFIGDVSYTTTVALQVFQYTPLSVSPLNINQIFQVGDPNQPATILNIQSDVNWSIVTNQNWLSTSQSNGSGDANVSLFVDISGFNVGVYNGQFLVDDGTDQITGYVSITMNGNGSQQNHLIVNPQNIQFSENYQDQPSSSKTVTVDSTQDVSITKNVNWLSVSENSLTAGVKTFVIETQNTDAFSVGQYPAEITLTTADNVHVINVVLSIIQETTSGLKSTGFYFAENRNKLNLTNATANSEAILSFTTQGTLALKNYTRKVPYFKNAASPVIGLETENLLRPSAIPRPLNSQFYIAVKPIRIDFSVADKILGETNTTPRVNYQDLKFINGRKPYNALKDYFDQADIIKSSYKNLIPNFNNPYFPGSGFSVLQAVEYDYSYRLTYLPKKIYTPKDGIIAFSLYSDFEINQASLLITPPGGELPLAYYVPMSIQENTKIYTCIVNLSDYDLQTGQKIELFCDLIEAEIIIRDTEYPTTQLIWENEWDCPEIFNLTGKVEIIEESDNTLSVTTREGKDYSKNLEIKNPKSFKINTGKIFTDQEVAFLSKVLLGKNVFLEIEGNRYQVINDFDDITVKETRRFLTDFDLTFDLAEV